jgi:tetratricopeptide (TPR) repeat protein
LYWQQPEAHLVPILNEIWTQGISTNLFMPTGAAALLAQIRFGLTVHPYFFQYEAAKQPLPDIDFSEPVPPFGQNVVVTALMLALHLGCNPIYLVGCDQDFFRWTSPEAYYESKFEHFYDQSQEVRPMGDYQWTYEEVSRDVRNLRYQYEKLLEYAKIKGVEVFNATKGGYLEIFPRVTFESLFDRESNDDWVDLLQDSAELVRSSLDLMERGQYQAALALVDRAKALHVDRFTALKGLDYLRAVCLAKLGLKHPALMALRADLLFRPEHHQEAEQLARILEQEGGIESHALSDLLPAAPVAAFNLIRAGNPEFADHLRDDYIRQGEELFSQGQLADALRRFRAAWDLDDRLAVIPNNLGVILWQLDEPDQALRHFERAIRLDPGFRDPVLNAAEIHRSRGGYDEMERLYETYLQRHPDDQEVAGLLEDLRSVTPQEA